MAIYNVHTTLRDVGSQTINTAGVHQFVADEPTKSRGTDAGPNPVQYLLGSVGACLGASAASLVHRPSSHVKIEKFEVEVTGETERFPDKSSRVQSIHVKLTCRTNLDKEGNQKFIEDTIHLCTVHDTLKDTVEFTFEITD